MKPSLLEALLGKLRRGFVADTVHPRPPLVYLVVFMIVTQKELVDPATALSAKWQAADDADAGSVDIIMIRTFQIVNECAATVGAELVVTCDFILAVIAGEKVTFGTRHVLPPFGLRNLAAHEVSDGRNYAELRMLPSQ